jgi:hypothetical protein
MLGETPLVGAHPTEVGLEGNVEQPTKRPRTSGGLVSRCVLLVATSYWPSPWVLISMCSVKHCLTYPSACYLVAPFLHLHLVTLACPHLPPELSIEPERWRGGGVAHLPARSAPCRRCEWWRPGPSGQQRIRAWGPGRLQWSLQPPACCEEHAQHGVHAEAVWQDHQPPRRQGKLGAEGAQSRPSNLLMQARCIMRNTSHRNSGRRCPDVSGKRVL